MYQPIIKYTNLRSRATFTSLEAALIAAGVEPKPIGIHIKPQEDVQFMFVGASFTRIQYVNGKSCTFILDDICVSLTGTALISLELFITLEVDAQLAKHFKDNETTNIFHPLLKF